MICQHKYFDPELCYALLQFPVLVFAARTLNNLMLNVVVCQCQDSLVHLTRMKLCSFHNLSGAVHEPDGPGDFHSSVDGRHGAHHEPPVVVLHFVLQEGGDADVDVLEEVQDGVSEKGKLQTQFFYILFSLFARVLNI